MRLSPLAAVAAACVLTLTACGDDGGDDSSSADKSPSASSSSTSDKAESEDESESGDEAPEDKTLCATLNAKDVKKIVGIDLKKGDAEGSTCNFSVPRDAASGSVIINETSLKELGGVGGVKKQITLLGDLKIEKVSDVGDEAFIGVGGGSPDLAVAAGAVIVEESVVMASVATDQRLSQNEIKEKTVALLELVADKV